VFARIAAILCVIASAVGAEEDTTVARCLSCHKIGPDRIDIVGIKPLASLPVEWPYLFEDGFDLNADGIAGVMRFVSSTDRPRPGIFGSHLAAARFEDFALIAAGAHGIAIDSPAEMARVRAAFEALSPDPDLPDPDALQRFEARGCSGCHVTRRFEHEGRSYMPLSDFLLHDLGEGPRRTTPLWGCPTCLDAPGHVERPSVPATAQSASAPDG
jgi:hypothetical protein